MISTTELNVSAAVQAILEDSPKPYTSHYHDLPSRRINLTEIATYIRTLQTFVKELESPPMLYTGTGRWETGIRNIVTLLWGSSTEFEVKSVVDAVAELLTERNSLRKQLTTEVLGYCPHCGKDCPTDFCDHCGKGN